PSRRAPPMRRSCPTRRSSELADVEPIHDFEGWSFGGGASTAALVLGPDGSFYGASEAGGYADNGAVWRVAPDGSFDLLHGYLGTDRKSTRLDSSHVKLSYAVV